MPWSLTEWTRRGLSTRLVAAIIVEGHALAQPFEAAGARARQRVATGVDAGGVAFVSVHAVRGEVASHRLASVRLRGLRVRRHFHAIHGEARTLPAGARAFVAMLVAQAEVSPGRVRAAP